MSDKPEKSSKPKHEKKHRRDKTASTLEKLDKESPNENASKEKEQAEPAIAENEPTESSQTEMSQFETSKASSLSSAPSELTTLDETLEVASVRETTLTDADKFERVSPSVLASFGKIIDFSKELGISYTRPEFVFIGAKNSGKTTLLEVLLHKATLLSTNSVRPLTLNINYRDETNRFVLRKDYSMLTFSEDIDVSPEELSANIMLRNDVTERYDPIILNYITKEMYPVSYFDTVSGNFEKIPELIKPPHRFAVVVIDSRDIAAAKPYIEIVRKIDTSASKTFFVYTHFNEVAQGFQNSRDAAKFFNKTEANAYFLTLPCGQLRTSDEKAAVQTQLQLSRRDKSALIEIQTDTKYMQHLGLPDFHGAMLSLCWKHYQSQLPLGLQSLRKQIVLTQRECENTKSQLNSLTQSSLRSLAAQHTAEYLNTVSEVVKGSCEGNTLINGQTLEEEQQRAGLSLSDEIEIEELKDKLPNADKRLYGGQQFVRLLAEFKLAATQCGGPNTAALDCSGDHGGLGSHNALWAAADLAKQHSQNVFIPLIERLVIRASYLFGRIPNIVFSILEAKKILSTSNSTSAEFPYFLNRLGEYYTSYVDSVAKNTLLKCRDEFYSTKTLCWDLTENTTVVSSSSKPSVWAEELFGRIKQRIIRNTLAKMYNFFLTPLEKEIWGVVQSKVSCLEETELADLFKLSENHKKFDETIKTLEKKVARLETQEKEYKLAAGEFAYQK